MHTIFSRSRTNSTPNKNKLSLPLNDGAAALDEFGRVSSRSSNRGISGTSSSPLSKKDKKKAKEQDKRLRTFSTARDRQEYDAGSFSPLPTIPDGAFLPLNLERPRDESGAVEQPKEHDYGYLSCERHVVLGLEEVSRLVDVVAEELATRGGLTTPFIFSSLALDVSSPAIKRLIQTFLRTCSPNAGNSAGEAELRWREEARFAGPHELGMCLRWALARVVRSVGGQDVRGLIAWDQYTEFRDAEAALNYPPSHFATLLPDLVPPLRSIILNVLTLLTRLTAHSASSGHTPPTLSPLFGPLFFGLGPATLAFHHTYVHYLRAAHAMEHILLSFIRWQDHPRPTTTPSSGELNAYGSAAALGVPTRLKEWIKGYPAMLPSLHDRKDEKPQARRGARTVRVLSVRRNVRMYTPDLVKSAATWAHRRPGAASTNTRGLAVSKEWDRIAPATLKLPPRYAESYKKRMDMAPNFHPDTYGLSAAPSVSSYSSTTSSGTSASLLEDKDYFGLGLGGREGEDRFRSLTDLKWGEFESMGFGGLGVEDNKKLQFDLTEGARTARNAKRATLSWNDFSASGFSRTDDPLKATLQFSTPVSNTISSWPTHNAEISKKLKKSQKALPAFGWDTEPVMGSEEVIEEAFLDVFCDLIYGGGWMDLERGEELDRECNWALIEFKSLPASRMTATGGSDPRTATTLILFEEFVPLEYRQQLAETGNTRRRLPSLFSQSTKSKQWKPAPTLNGRPYVVGSVPLSPSYREVEFEGMLRGGSTTKVISLGTKTSTIASPPPPTASRMSYIPSTIDTRAGTPRPAISVPFFHGGPRVESPSSMKNEDPHSDSTTSPSVRKTSRFRLPVIPVVSSPGGAARKTVILPAEYSSVDFETRLASYSDEEPNGDREADPEAETAKQKRRESRDDAWVDILVGTQNRRMAGQDAQLNRRGIRTRSSDPDLASLEVAQALAAVRDRSFSPPMETVQSDRDEEIEQARNDADVDEIETVPRMDEERPESFISNEEEYDPEQEQDDEGDSVVLSPLTDQQFQREQRRLGYFDLHPERRPASFTQADDDPRARLADEDSEDDDEDGPYGSRYDVPPIVPQKPTAMPTQQDFPRRSPDRSVDALKFARPEDARADGERSQSKVEASLPSSLSSAADENGNGTALKLGTPSKTAALIEMYRERERGAPPKAPVIIPIPAANQPSRLPVRALPSTPKDPAFLTPPHVQKATTTSPKHSPPDPIRSDLPPAPVVPLISQETGRASPARYVHGAPLHNVLEEEEEDV